MRESGVWGKWAKSLKWVVLLLLALVSTEYLERAPWRAAGEASSGDGASVVAAWEAQRSRVWLETGGTVLKTLRDDNEGDRHQRFLLRVAPRLKVLVAHNIDLAPRVPLKQGEQLKLRGRYEWNEKGGVIHWTHHDPSGRRDGGWIEYQGKRYF